MGQTGSYTTKIEVAPALTVFTKWNLIRMKELMKTCQHTLADTFALRLQEFIFIIGKKTLSLPNAKLIFNTIFDTDSNSLVDKFEILCGIILLSALSSQEKVEYLYDVFDFNCKGYLVETEVVLMLRTITNCADKIDNNMGAPPDYRIREIAHDAMYYAIMNTGSLRKYELVQFAANYPTVRAFLESWRGHASQVLLASNQKWQDQLFLNLHTSICPSIAWLSLGLPPSDFITWKRKEKIASGCNLLFAHSEKYMKSSDRIAVDGVGCLAHGYLQQGLLADRWIMNGLASILPFPSMVKFIFSVTGQENIGRYCIRLFEGRGWVSIFIDDRIPCNPLFYPAFLSSSCENECWPLILEKGFAKYFGSYGHLGACGIRYDSTETGLKMLTGGHIHKIPSSDFEWKSVAAEVTGKDGVALILKLLNEGSIISFGKSESRIFMYPKKKKKKDKYVTAKSTYPYGRLFPALGIETRKGYRFVVLRDAWGLVPEASNGPDTKYGQCRLFQIPVENIVEEFDCMYICRYPDSMKNYVFRESKKLIHIKPPTTPWVTEILHRPSESINNPAKFLIKVYPSPPDGILTKRNPDEVVESTNDPLEVCLTVSSSNFWSETSDLVHPNPPRLYGILFPTDETKKMLQESNQNMIDMYETTKIHQMPPPPTDFSSYLHLTNSNVSKYGSTSQVQSNSQVESHNISNEQSLTDNNKKHENENLTNHNNVDVNNNNNNNINININNNTNEFIFCCERSWMSHSFLLPPGEYILITYVEENKLNHSQSNSGRSSIHSNINFNINKSSNSIATSSSSNRGSISIISDEDDKVSTGIWCQLTSIGKVGLHAYTPEIQQQQQQLSNDPLNENDLNNILLNKIKLKGLLSNEKWPFMADYQQEVSSKGLIKLLTNIRTEINKVNINLLETKYENTQNDINNKLKL